MGKSFAMQVEQSAKLVNYRVVNEYINRLSAEHRAQLRCEGSVHREGAGRRYLNAFALPGGYFYVQTGLILAADNEAELAGVMAHEIGHVAACDAARQQTRGNMLNWLRFP